MKLMSKRVAGLLLAVVMAVGLLPASAFAARVQEETAEVPVGDEIVASPASQEAELPESAPTAMEAPAELMATVYKYLLATDATLANGDYQIRTVGLSEDRTLHASTAVSGNSYTDHCKNPQPANNALDVGGCGNKHVWTLAAVTGGYTIKSVDANKYLTTSASTEKAEQIALEASDSPTTFQITKVTDGYQISHGTGADKKYLSWNNSWQWSSGAATLQLYLGQNVEETMDTIDDWHSMVPAPGQTQNQPFPSGTGGSANYRIPAIITLKHQSNASKNGRIVAAIDARWNQTGDGGNLDTILSYSDDNGTNWSYNFPNYFGDSVNARYSSATAFIDPQLTEGLDGTIYLMTDIWPGGVALNSADNNNPDCATGYVTVDGVKRMALYTTVTDQTDANYAYYVGDFEGTGDKYATIYAADKTASNYYVDEYYYLYEKTGTDKAPANDKIFCQQLGSDKWVQQNVFFKRADLHVRNTSHLWIVKSTDGGETWSKPILNNDQVRTGENRFYGVGPGAGLCVESDGAAGSIPNGTILMPTYINSGEIAGFIYTTDNGATWHRGNNASNGGQSSESCIVQLNNTTVRQFFRDSWSNSGVFRYTDHTWDSTANNGQGGWTTGELEQRTDIPRYGPCQMSALRYSQSTEDGETIILLSAPTNPSARKNGKVYAAKVKADGTMEKLGSYEVTGEDENYAYSSISELADGRIAVFYEDTGTNVPVKIIPFGTIRYGEELGGLIRQADALKAAAYSEATWTALQTALTPARTAMESGVKADIEKATTDLRTALDNLEILDLVITGTVKNATTNAPVSGAVITLEDEDYRPVGLTATTGADGVFRFTSTDDVPLSVGTYQLKVQAPGYLVSTHAATEITDRDNLTSTTDITLTPESTEGSIYSNNFDENDTSMMGYLSPDGTSGVPTFEHVEYNGSGAIKVTMNSGDRGVNNAVVKVDAAKITNGTVSFDITGTTNTSRLGVTLRGVDPLKRIYMGQGNNIRSWFWEYWNGGTGSTYPSESVKPIGIYPGETRRVRVELNDKNIQLFIDGVQVYNENMTSPPTEAGYVGINMQDNSGTSYILDNFRVVSKDAPPVDSHFISGRVMDGDTPVANAQIVLRKADDTRVTSITTNANGEFKTSPTTETTVKLSVSAAGYVTPSAETISLTADITGKVISLTADKTALTALYNAHAGDEQGEYSDASWTTFQTALAAAGTVKDKTGATKAEIDKAIADLNAAIAALTEDEPPVAVDTTALEAAIAAANAAKEGVQTIDGKTPAEVSKGTKFVTTEVMTALNAAIQDATDELNNDQKTDGSVSNAVDALNAAVETFTDAIQTGVKSTGGAVSGGGTFTPPSKTETETKEDGTKVTTETKPDGTKVETTETPDGTKAVVETKPDGSKTQTVEQADGTKSELVATKDGDVTITVTDPEGEELVKTEIPAEIPEPETKFEDVTEAAPWAEEAIDKMAGLKLVEGTGDNKYSPVAPMTRGSLATVLHRLSQGKTDYEVTFKDVAEGKYYTEGVVWAAKANVVKGVSEDVFAPDQTITREQLAVMLCRYAKLVGLNTKADAKTLESFTDGENTGAWAVDGMAWCVENGILKGKGQNNLDPTADVTRAEVAVMLDRFIALLK